jgi:hypothetical protein
VTPVAELDVPAQVREEKLEQKVVDFERLDEAGLKEGQWDVVFIACVCLLFLFCFYSSSPSVRSTRISSTGFIHRCSLCGLQIGHDRERRRLARELYKDRQGVRVVCVFDREFSGHSPRSFLGMS